MRTQSIGHEPTAAMLPLPARLLLSSRAAVILALLLAAALRLYHLGTTPLWTDELFTSAYAKTGLSYLWTDGIRLEPTPPLYYSLICLVEQIAGDSEFVLRLPSFLASLAGIWAAALLAGELSARKLAGPLAALLLTLMPLNIFFAQEARSYALQGAALGFALLGFARFLREPANPRALALYGAAAVLATYLHMSSVVAVAAFNVAALLSMFGSSRLLNGKALGRWALANSLVALLCLPLLPLLLSPTAAAATSWYPVISRWWLANVSGSTLFGPALGWRTEQAAELGVPAILALMVVPPWRPGRRAATVLVAVPLLFLALVIGISLFRPILINRTLAWMLLPLAVALGDVLARRGLPLRLAALAVFGASTALHLARVDTLKEDWRSFLSRLPGLAPPALVVLAPHTPPGALIAYAPGAATPVRLDDGGAPVPETTVIPHLLGTETITVADMRAAIDMGRPVWLIFRKIENDWMLQATAALPKPKVVVRGGGGEGAVPAIGAVSW